MRLVSIVALTFTFSVSAVSSASDAPDQQASITATFSSMPLPFTQNNGQWPDSILYRASTGGATMWFTPTGAYYQFTRRIPKSRGESLDSPKGVPKGSPLHIAGWSKGLPHGGMDEQPDSIEISMIKAEFVGSNMNASAMGLSLMEYKCNYFIGNEPDKWRTDVPNYESIQYQEVYPGIDLKYYGNGKQMEYDFIVSPGADYSKIQIRYEGAESLSIGENGELIIKIANGEIIEQPPIVHQTIDGRKVNLEGQYLVGADNTFGFAIDNRYNSAHELVIDPVLVYSTYLGGSDYEQLSGIAVDASGAAYVTGYTFSTNFPTINTYQTNQVAVDAFVTKLNNAGNSLAYSTYLGGGSDDYSYGIAVDASGAAYVTGRTLSNDFPTLNPFQADQGSSDVFVTKVNSTGNSLVYSTYLGGSDHDYSFGIAADAVGAAYVTGETSSTNFPTLNPYQSTNQGWGDVFVTKLSSAGNSLVFSTYLGGSSFDIAEGIAVDAVGAAYVTGGTWSANFPTLNPYQGTHQGGNYDVFVTKLNSVGNSLVYSTYLGGNGNEYTLGIAVDAAGAAYVTGETWSANFPTLNPYQTDQVGQDAFVTKLNSVGNSLVYSTYLGGNGNEYTLGIAVDDAGAAYVTGLTEATNFPTLNPYQTDQVGQDAFVTKLSNTGNSLVYSTYLGGNGPDGGAAIAVDASGAAYVTGGTSSTNFPTLNPYQTYQGSLDAFVTKFSEQNPNCPLLTVAPFYQYAQPWGDDLYDGGGTVKRWGCAMTCLAMIARYYGVNQGADGLPVDPGNLNNWLRTHDGYDPSGNVRWPAIEPYTGGRVSFETKGSSTTPSENLLLGDLQANKPVVLYLKAFGHFVLARGKSDCTHYNIVDPLSSTRTSLSAYNNQWTNLRRFKAAPNNPQRSENFSVLVSAYEDIEIMAIDSLGRKTGYDMALDSVFEEIPNSFYYKDFLEPDSTEADSVAISDSLPNPVTTSIYFEDFIHSDVSLSFYFTDTTEFDFDVLTYAAVSDTPYVLSYNLSAPIGDSVVFILDFDSVCCLGARGDANNDGASAPNILDLTYLVDRIFRGGPAAICPKEADVNSDGSTSNILDLTFLVDRIFRGGSAPGPC